VIFASYELASAILADPTIETSANAGTNTKRTLARDKVGDLETERETEFFMPTIAGSASAGRFPPAVQEYLKGLLGGQLSLTAVSGSNPSVFLGKTFCAEDPAS
jgi:hypothetical protein